MNCVEHQDEGWRSRFLPDISADKGHHFLAEPSPHKANRQVPYLSLYQHNRVGPTKLCSQLIPWEPTPPNLQGPPKSFPVAPPYKWPVFAHAADFLKIPETSSILPRYHPYLPLSCPRSGTNSRQPRFKAWLLLSMSMSSTSSSDLRINLYLMQVPLGRAQAAADLAFYLLGDPRTSTPNG